MLRKVLIFVLVCCPLIASGQLLSVTATLTDSDTTVWVNATCTVAVNSPNGAPFYNGTPVPTAPQACAVNGSGVLSTSIYNTSTITPTGATYTFSIQSATSAMASTFQTAVTAANQTSNLSALITAPRFDASRAFTYGYADVEAQATAPGAQYYNTTTPAGRVWTGSAWANSGGGGGSSGISGLTLNCIPKAATATTITGCSSISDAGAGSVVQTFGLNGQVSYAVDNSTNGTGSYSSYQLNVVSANAVLDLLGSNFTPSGLFTGGELYIATVAGPIVLNTQLNAAVTLATNSIARFTCDGAGAACNSVVPLTTGGSPVPIIDTGTPTTNLVACIKAVGPPISIGTCSSVVGAGGACTCN